MHQIIMIQIKNVINSKVDVEQLDLVVQIKIVVKVYKQNHNVKKDRNVNL